MENSLVSIQTYLSPLDPIDLSRPEDPEDASESGIARVGEARVKLDIRKLSAILNLQNLPWGNAKVYLSENAALLIEMDLARRSVIRFFVPVMEISELE